MSELKASIAMFQKKMEYPTDVSCPYVPQEVFEAVARISYNKRGCELVRGRDGVYVIQYSETGPFRDHFSDDWMPVYVMKVREWHSGGVTKEEFEEYKHV